MTAERVRKVVSELARAYPIAVCELDYRNPWELLVTTVLNGRRVCGPRRPVCTTCVLAPMCPKIGVV